MVSAYCAFTGPLHGGAPGPVLDMLDEIKASGDIDGWIEKSSPRGGRLMGFGHRVFRIRDPRADVLRAAVAALNKDAGRLAFAAEVEPKALAALARHKPGRSLQSNIEMNAALLLDAVGVPRDAFTPGVRHRPLGRLARQRAGAAEDRPDDPAGVELRGAEAGGISLPSEPTFAGALGSLKAHLVSRFRRLYPFAARPFTSVGTKGTLATL